MASGKGRWAAACSVGTGKHWGAAQGLRRGGGEAPTSRLPRLDAGAVARVRAGATARARAAARARTEARCKGYNAGTVRLWLVDYQGSAQGLWRGRALRHSAGRGWGEARHGSTSHHSKSALAPSLQNSWFRHWHQCTYSYCYNLLHPALCKPLV